MRWYGKQMASCDVNANPTSRNSRSHSQLARDRCVHVLQVLLKKDVCLYPRLYKATRITLSKTSFRPCCVFAEHSKTISPPSLSHSACADSSGTRLAPLVFIFSRSLWSVRKSFLQPTRMNEQEGCAHPLTSGSHLGGGRTVEGGDGCVSNRLRWFRDAHVFYVLQTGGRYDGVTK